MKHSLYSVAVSKHTLAPMTRAASENGAAVDRQVEGGGAFRSAMLTVVCGTITDGTHTFKIQESDDNSVWSDVAADHLQGTAPVVVAADDNKTFDLGYTGVARYLRAVVTVTGTPATGGIYTGTILLGWPGTMPATH